MLQYVQLQKIAKVFRLIELCVILVFLTWAFTRLPVAVKISADYFWKLVAVILTPIFIFVVSNVIVLVLLIKSGQFCGETPAAANAGDNLCDELISDSDNSTVYEPYGYFPVAVLEDEIVYQDKQTILEVKSESNSMAAKTNSSSESKGVKAMAVENVSKEQIAKLRRSETVKCRKVANPGEVPEDTVYLMDDEEFQHRIEAFIARQIKFHQEEKLAIVLHGHA